MKITILDGAVENPGDLSWEALAALGDLTVYDYTAPEEILSRIGDAPIILTNKTPITRQTMDACPNLRYIGVLATGFNVIDIAAAKEKGIVVANVPSYGTQAVAQFVMAQLLEICHRIGHHNDAVQQGRWTACRDFSFWDYPLMELAGKTFGIVGYGRIGQATAELARAFGMNVIYYSRHGSGEGYVPLDELYARSDIVSLHLPVLESTKGLVTESLLRSMKPTALFINAARSPIVDCAALEAVLNEQAIGGAIIDVLETEPPTEADLTIARCPNVLLTPHICGATYEVTDHQSRILNDRIKKWMAGEELEKIVYNRAVLGK